MISYASVGDLPTFFFTTVVNEAVEHEDIDFILEEIEENAQDL